MKRGGELKRSPMPRGTSTLKQKTSLARTSTLKAKAQMQRRPPDPNQPKPKAKRGPGLKGRTPTAAEQRFMDLAGQVPCMACTKDGRENRHILLHHTDGRTKPGAHFKVLPICPPHHVQDDSDPLQRPSVHGRKATFTALYGTECELLAELYEMLHFTPPGELHGP